MGFPGGSVVRNLPASAGDAGSIPGSGRSPGEGNGNPLQYSCLGSPLDRGAWRAAVHGVAKSRTGLSHWALTHSYVHISCKAGQMLSFKTHKNWHMENLFKNIFSCDRVNWSGERTCETCQGLWIGGSMKGHSASVLWPVHQSRHLINICWGTSGSICTCTLPVGRENWQLYSLMEL